MRQLRTSDTLFARAEALDPEAVCDVAQHYAHSGRAGRNHYANMHAVWAAWAHAKILERFGGSRHDAENVRRRMVRVVGTYSAEDVIGVRDGLAAMHVSDDHAPAVLMRAFAALTDEAWAAHLDASAPTA